MDTGTIAFDNAAPVATITLTRPAVYNAVRRAELEALDGILTELERNPPRLVILSAAAPGFCSGIDLKESREATASFARSRATLMHSVLQRLRNLPALVITAIDGVAAGLGCELAISGDLRIASPSSRFSYPEPKVAVPSPTFHLNQLIGLARAQEMLYTARWIDADEALSWALITRLADDPLAAALALADDLQQLSPISLTKTKENLALGIADGQGAATAHHIEHVAAAADTADRKEALAAFADRRTPRFQGR